MTERTHRRLRLEDLGQDFLHFVIDEKNVIVETGPFQGWMWNGFEIHPDTLRRGARPLIRKGGLVVSLKCRITGIAKVPAPTPEPGA